MTLYFQFDIIVHGFEVLKTVKMSMLVFWVVKPCGLVGLVDAIDSEEYTASIFRAEVTTLMSNIDIIVHLLFT
jgi:hypothetical protein